MKKRSKTISCLRSAIICFLFLLAPFFGIYAQCGTGDCNGNSYLNSSNPNTLQYDNIVSTYHSTLMKANDLVMVWGEHIASNGTSNVLSPQALSPANGYNYTGSILYFTGGSAGEEQAQFALLTTDGLYIWGDEATLVHNNLTSGTGFQKITIDGETDGMPAGVNPDDVKMLFGAYGTLAIVTCTGEVFVLSFIGNKNGDGTDSNEGNQWHQVLKDSSSHPKLNNVVAVRGTFAGLVALTSSGELYTWGTGLYDGNNNFGDADYATPMTLPATAGTPKMIGMNVAFYQFLLWRFERNSYYLLDTNGNLYALGYNDGGQLGDFTTTESYYWVDLEKSNGVAFNDIAWISPNEHDYYGNASINALTNNGQLYAWGYNSENMLGGTGNFIGPTQMPGGLNPSEVITVVETGGHFSLIFKKRTTNYGFVGYQTQGSMGDGSNDSQTIPNYSFATSTITPTPAVRDLEICPGGTGNLNDALLENVPTGYDLKWYEDYAGTIPVANPSVVTVGNYYAFYVPEGTTTICPTTGHSLVEVIEFYNPDACTVCNDEVNGNDFSWSTDASDGTYSETIYQPGSNAGFVFDIYKLDNSFNMKINEENLAIKELEFQNTNKLIQTVRFADGSFWNDGTVSNIWDLTGTTGKPILRVKIAPSGQVLLYGSKVSSSNPAYQLEPLILINGNKFNTIAWNTTDQNEITVTQHLESPTSMDGKGYGQTYVPCTYTLLKEGVFNDESNNGSAHAGETITFTFTLDNANDVDIYNIDLTDPLFGGSITTSPAGDDGDGILQINETWIYTLKYTITQSDIDIGGVYNRATVTGTDASNNAYDPEESVDPTPYGTSTPGYDPIRPYHTFVFLEKSSMLITNPMIRIRVK